jgi:hypothetical protein
MIVIVIVIVIIALIKKDTKDKGHLIANYKNQKVHKITLFPNTMNHYYTLDADAMYLYPRAFSNELHRSLNGRGGGCWAMDMDMDTDMDITGSFSYGSSRNNKQQHTNNRSWELCDAEEWTALHKRLAVFPEEARTIKPPASVFSGNRSMLHEACCSSTVSPLTVNTIYCAWPQALLLRDSLEGRTPLHCALTNGAISPPSLDMICTILDLSQEGEEDTDMEQRVAQIQDNLGESPLHAACRVGASKKIIWALLDACPSALLTLDNEGMTPLRRLWTRLQSSVGQVKIDHIQTWTDLVQIPEVKDAWDKVVVFLQMRDMWHVPTFEPLEEEDEEGGEEDVCSGESPELDFQILHVIAANDCPSGLMSLALKLYPEEFLQLNEEGQSVLDSAIAQSRRPPSTTSFVVDESLCVVDILLRHDKDKAAQRYGGGGGLLYKICSANCCHSRPPLIRAILAGKGWSHGVGSLLEAEADIATHIDEGTGLYPFMMAATIATDASGTPAPPEMSIGTSFELLRQTPELINMTSSLLFGRKKVTTKNNSNTPQNKRRRSDAETHERAT